MNCPAPSLRKISMKNEHFGSVDTQPFSTFSGRLSVLSLLSLGSWEAWGRVRRMRFPWAVTQSRSSGQGDGAS